MVIRNLNPHRARWRGQKYNARDRGIVWNLSFQEWWDIWEKSGHYAERGCKRGEYCMSRINDIGAYEVGNVYINLQTQNTSDANKWSKQINTCRECTIFGIHYLSIQQAVKATGIGGRTLRARYDKGDPNIIFH